MGESTPAPWEGVTNEHDADVPEVVQDNAHLMMGESIRESSPQSVVVDTNAKGPKMPMIIAAVLVAFGLLGFVTVSYTHLTLPTNREV